MFFPCATESWFLPISQGNLGSIALSHAVIHSTRRDDDVLLYLVCDGNSEVVYLIMIESLPGFKPEAARGDDAS